MCLLIIKLTFYLDIAVDEEKGKQLADKNGIGFYQTSAQSNIGVKELFVYAVDLYIEKFGCEDNTTVNEDPDIEKRKKNKNKDDCWSRKKNQNKKIKKVTDDDEDEISNDLNVK